MNAQFGITMEILNRVGGITFNCSECYSEKHWPIGTIIAGEEIDLCECVDREFKKGEESDA